MSVYISLIISGEKNTKGKTKLSIGFNETLLDVYNSNKNIYKKNIKKARADLNNTAIVEDIDKKVFIQYVLRPLQKSAFCKFFASSDFIPASRSFYVNMQKNIFTLISSNLDIDPFLIEFGSLYEYSKKMYMDPIILSDKQKTLIELMNHSMTSIVKGNYEFSNGQEWIVSKGHKVKLLHTSSGQQESLPMLLVLSVLPILKAEEKGGLVFIEEPEAHLFPTSQNQIMSMISHLYEELNLGFFITTHSPYIIAALNNQILASEVVEAGKLTTKEYTKLNGSGVPIKFEDVASYTISKGVAKSINDNEYKMIGADMLDGISDHFGKVSNKLLKLKG